jgi:hypothetical protein
MNDEEKKTEALMVKGEERLLVEIEHMLKEAGFKAFGDYFNGTEHLDFIRGASHIHISWTEFEDEEILEDIEKRWEEE